MYSEIIAFAFIEDKKIYVQFDNGNSGLFDMANYINSDFFNQLNNSSYFEQASLQFGVITWPKGQDISPTTIEREMTPFDVPNLQLIRENRELVG